MRSIWTVMGLILLSNIALADSSFLDGSYDKMIATVVNGRIVKDIRSHAILANNSDDVPCLSQNNYSLCVNSKATFVDTNGNESPGTTISQTKIVNADDPKSSFETKVSNFYNDGKLRNETVCVGHTDQGGPCITATKTSCRNAISAFDAAKRDQKIQKNADNITSMKEHGADYKDTLNHIRNWPYAVALRSAAVRVPSDYDDMNKQDAAFVGDQGKLMGQSNLIGKKIGRSDFSELADKVESDDNNARELAHRFMELCQHAEDKHQFDVPKPNPTGTGTNTGPSGSDKR